MGPNYTEWLLVEVAITSTKFTLEVGRQQLKDNMTRQKLHTLYHIPRLVGQKGARPSVGCQAGVEKNTTGKMVNNNKLLKCKKAFFISSLNCRTLSSAKSIGELTVYALMSFVSRNIAYSMMTLISNIMI